MQIAIVTGGSSGIGQSAALRIAARGTGVILTYNSSPERALETVRIIEKDGGTAVALPLDVGRTETFPAFHESVVAALRETWQRDDVDFLVNNAGRAEAALFQDTTEAMFDRLAQVLLKGPYFLTQTLLPLLTDGGAIVNVTSNSALTAATEPGYSTYGSLKGGLAVLTRYLAKELSPRGIRVNAVAPGPTRTGMISDDVAAQFPEVIASLVDRTALGRLGDGDDVGRAIAALLSDDGAWITGEQIEVSGGFRL